MSYANERIPPTDLDQYPSVLTAEDAAELLGLRVHTIRRLCRRGELPGKRIGKQWLILRDELRLSLTPDREAD